MFVLTWSILTSHFIFGLHFGTMATDLQVISTPGDGHCLLHAVLKSWSAQLPGPPPTLHSLKCDIFLESINNWDKYTPFLPDFTCKAKYLKQVEQHIIRKNYNSSYKIAHEYY